MYFTIPSSLPYAYNALEPYIDAQTMELHHIKHHQAYVDNLNKAIKASREKTMEMEKGEEGSILNLLLKKISTYSAPVRNNAGGHFNHTFFWTILKPNAPLQPGGSLLQLIEKVFGSFELFKEQFIAKAMAHFGSGWTWLSIDKKGDNLFISTTPNQDNPLMDVIPIEEQGIPILGLDIWEHAYYLLYQNRRLAYIEAFWHIINWEMVENKFIEAVKIL